MRAHMTVAPNAVARRCYARSPSRCTPQKISENMRETKKYAMQRMLRSKAPPCDFERLPRQFARRAPRCRSSDMPRPRAAQQRLCRRPRAEASRAA